MTVRYGILVVMFCALLAGCGSSGTRADASTHPIDTNLPTNTEPPTKTTPPVLDQVPAQYREEVRTAKMVSLSSLRLEKNFDMFGQPKYDTVTSHFTIDGKTYTINDTIDFANFAPGYTEKTMPVAYTTSTRGQAPRNETASGKITAYSQAYSVVFGVSFAEDSSDLFIKNPMYASWFSPSNNIRGLHTTNTQIAALGDAVATYHGAAINGIDQGELSYTVDFGTRLGSGTITGIAQTGTIDLLQASIRPSDFSVHAGMSGIFGDVQLPSKNNQEGTYILGFFGPEAEEIAGYVWFNNILETTFNGVGFAGKRP